MNQSYLETCLSLIIRLKRFRAPLTSKTSTVCGLILLLLLMYPSLGRSSNFYVDYVSGLDSNNGTSTATPFKHCPGDTSATGTAGSTTLQAGDNVYFKGGVTYSNPQIFPNDGVLKCQSTNVNAGTASIDATGLFTDNTVNFSTSNVLANDLLYIFNGTTNGAFLETCGLWTVTNVTSHTLSLANFDGTVDTNAELTYVVFRPITFTTNASFGSGPAILDGGGSVHYFFQPGNWNRFSGFTFKNPFDVVAGGCNFTGDAIFHLNTGGSYFGPVIENCLFTNCFSGIYEIVDSQTYLVWRNNVFRDSGQFGVVGQFCSLVQNSLFTNCCGGIRNLSAYSIARHNTVVRMTTICGSHADGIGPFFSGSATPYSNKYGWIYDNWVENAPQGIFLTFGQAAYGGTMGWTIANNILCGTYGDAGAGTGSLGIFVEAAPDTRIYNNVFIGTNGERGWITCIHVGDRDSSVTGWFSTNVSLRNNIGYNPHSGGAMGDIVVYDTAMTNGFSSEGNYFYNPHFLTDTVCGTAQVNPGGGTDFKTNLTFAQWQALAFDNAGHSTNSIDPNFVQPVGVFQPDFDLHLAAPIGGWYGLPVRQSDFGGFVVPANLARSIGAYQFQGPLLDVVSNAFAAYSIRKLRSTYTGGAIRVRRSSDNTQQDIGFSGADLDTNSLVSFCGAGNGFVTVWYDQSGNTNDVQQPTSSQQPQIVSSGSILTGPNGRPIVRFTQSSQQHLGCLNSSTLQTAASLYVVCGRAWSSATPSNWPIPFSFGLHTISGYAMVAEAQPSGYGLLGSKEIGTVGNGYNSGRSPSTIASAVTLTDNTYHLLNSVLASSGTGSWLDGSEMSYDSNNNASLPTITSWADVGGSSIDGDWFDGGISEIVLYQAAHGSSTQGTVRSIINTYYLLY